jgi:hypothetical protein
MGSTSGIFAGAFRIRASRLQGELQIGKPRRRSAMRCSAAPSLHFDSMTRMATQEIEASGSNSDLSATAAGRIRPKERLVWSAASGISIE